jgi:prepilin-type N-terminal cleavage/methylation domain-containing protein
MRYGTRPSRRTGFTLVELLVVMGILALLAALTAAGISSVRTSVMNKATGQTVTKFQTALNQQVRAVAEEANRDTNPHLAALVGFCDGDKDRAKALLTYLYMKWEFPQTFAEATNPVLLPAGTGTVLTLPPRKTFAAVAAGGVSLDEQPAVLLYLILTEKSNRGTGVAMDDATASAQTDIGSYKAFKDAYGTPIVFQRFFQSPELNAPPYVNPNAKPLNNPLLDPFDRLSIDQKTAKLANWNLTNPTNQGIALAALNANGGPAVAFDGRNKVITVIAAGENARSNKTSPFSPPPAGNDGYVYGYRLARIGNQGN